MCQQFNVTGYPTLKYFENEEEDRPFNGQRNADAIVSFMMKEAKSEPIPETQGKYRGRWVEINVNSHLTNYILIF